MKRQNRSRRIVRAININRKASLLIISAATMACASGALGANGTWNGLTDNNWSTANGTGNWGTLTAAPGLTTGNNDGDTATFSVIAATAFSTVTVDTGRNVKSVTFDNTFPTGTAPAYTLTGSALLLSSGGTLQTTSVVNATETINNSLFLEPASSTTAGTYTFTNSSPLISGLGSLDIAGNISGDTTVGNTTTAGITLSLSGSNYGIANISGAISNGGAGTGLGLTISSGSNATWILSGANTYTGATAINGGTVVFANSGAISSGSAITVNGGAAVFGTGALPASGFAVTSGGVGYAGGILDPGFQAFAGALANPASTSLLLDSPTDASTSINFNSLTGNATSMALGANGNFTYSGTLTPNSSLGYRLGGGSGVLTIGQPLSDANGPGTTVTVIGSAGGSVAANSQNTYSGSTTIGTGGILIVTNLASEGGSGGIASSLGESSNAAGNVILSSGTLRYTGNVATTDRGFTVNSSGSIDSSGTGLLTLTGTIVPGSGATNTLTLIGGTGGVFSTSYADNGSNLGAITKSGTGTWTLAAANNYSGPTTVSAGLLDIGNSGALGTGTLGTLVLNGGALDNQTGSALTINNNETWGGNFTYVGTNSLNTGSGAVSLTGTRTVTILSSSITVPGIVSNSTAGFGITKQGLGTLSLLNSANSYTGTTSINGGLVALGTTGSISSSPIALANGEFSVSGVGLGGPRTTSTNGALTDNAGSDIVTLNTDSGQTVDFTAGSLATRAQGSVALYRGPSLGVNAPNTTGANILFSSAPAVTNTGTTATALGSFDSTSGNTTLGVPNAPVLRAALIDNTSATGTGVGFATYDPTNGVRLLNPSTEQYLITTGSANTYTLATTDDNVRIGSSVGNPLTALTITGKSTNTLQLDNTNNSTPMTITNSGTALFPVNGLLFSGSAPITLTGGSLSFTNNSGANNDMVIMSTNTAGVTIATTLASSGSNQKSYTFGGPGNFTIPVTPATSSSGGVFFDGPGTATLTSNSWGPSSTGTVINGGTVVLGTGFGLTSSVTRPVSVAAGATLNIDNATIASTINAGMDALNNINGLGGTVTNANVGSTTAVLTNFPLSLDNSAGNFAGSITGKINLIIAKQGSTSTTDTQILTGSSTYTGSTLITSNSALAGVTTAALQIGFGGSLPSTTAVTLGGGFATSGTVVTTDSGVLILGDSNGPVSQTIGGLATAGTGTGPTSSEVVAGNTLDSTLTVNNSGSPTIFAGSLGGPLLNQNNLIFAKSGTAQQTLTGASTYTGGTTINAGTLAVDNTTGSGTGSGPVLVKSSGILAGTGTIAGAVTVNSGGHLDPGDASLGTLNIGSSGSLTLNGGSILDFDFTNTSSDTVVDGGGLSLLGTAGASTGNTAGVGINVLASGTSGKFTPTGSGTETFNLIQFSGTAPATNTLSVLNPVSGDGYSFDVSGSDVQLVITFPPTLTWTDNSSDQKWSTNTDWTPLPASAPNAAGASITFPNLASHPMAVDLNGSKTVGAISFSTGAAYTISASSGTLTLDNNGSNSTINVAAASGSPTLQTISAPISLVGPASPSLNAIITTATVNDSLALSNTISGNGGILTTGSGTVALTGSNTYLGGTTISGGVVQINSASSLGASTGTAVINAGTLEVLNSISTTRSFELGSASSTIQIDGGGTYEIDGNITDVSPTALGTLNLTIPGGSGTLILTGNNTFSGGTNVPANATLQLGNTAGTVGGSLGANGILTNNGVINVGASSGSPLATNTTVSIGSNIAGAGPLNQFGGSLVLSGSNANFTGAVTITNGTLVLGSTSPTGTGTGNLALTNTTITETASGTIGNNPASGAAASAISTLTITGALNIDTGGANNMLIGAQLIGASGTSITRTGGTGMLSLGIAGNTNFSNAAPYTNAFAGTFTNNIGSLTLLSRGSGSNAAQFNFNAGASYPVVIGGIGGSINFGSLSGNQPIANLNSSAAGRLVVGNLNMNTTYSGVIGSANATGSNGLGLLKVGSGTLTLTGQNMYAGQALTGVTGTPTVVQSGTLIAGSTAASDSTYGPFGPTTPLAAGTYPNYVLLGSNGNLGSANLLASGVTVANPIVVSGGGNTATTGSYTLALGGNNITGASMFSGGVTLENNLTVTQTSGGTLNLTGGITGTDAFTGPDAINGAIDHGEDGAANTTGTSPGSATGTAANNTGYQTVTFAGPGNITVNASANTTNTFGIYDSNDPNNQNNDGLGHYLNPNGFVSVSVTGGTITFAAQNQYSGATSISGGTLILGNLANASTPTARTQTSLSVSGGELQMASAGASGGSANGGRNVLVLTGVPVPNTSPSTPPTPVAPLAISGTGTIDLTNNDMLVQNVGVAGAATISTEIASGRAGGSWTGTGITSSAAAASPTLHALGMELNDTNAIGSASLSGNLSGSAITSSFDGQSTYDGDVLVKYTYVGDADLSGTVNAADYLRIDNAFSYNAAHPSGPLITGWANGDFNYDGLINGDDYTLIDNAFNSQGSVTFTAVPASAAEMVAGDTEQIAGASSTAVPEPTMIGLIGLGTIGLLKRRRRNCSLATK